MMMPRIINYSKSFQTQLVTFLAHQKLDHYTLSCQEKLVWLIIAWKILHTQANSSIHINGIQKPIEQFVRVV